MPAKRLALALATVLVAVSLLLATFATFARAQPRSRPPPGHPVPKPKASASASEPSDNAAAAASASAAGATAPAAAGDGGAIPAPPPAMSPSGGALSPLNPNANEFSDGGAAPPITIDYDRLLADVAALRARVAAVSDTLYKSKVAIALETSGDHGRIAGLSVSIDDGVVWTSPASFRASDATTIYEHSVAPGHHAITVDIERRDDRDDTFRSTQRSRFVVDVPTDQRLAVTFKLWDDSNIGGDFKSDHKGQYELRVRMRAEAQPVGK